MPLEGKSFVWDQDKSLKDSFVLIHFEVEFPWHLKTVILENKMSHMCQNIFVYEIASKKKVICYVSGQKWIVNRLLANFSMAEFIL